MAVSDALVVGEDWISEHYVTTDATKESFLARVLERRKEWEALEKPADPNAAPTPTPRSRFRSERAHLEELLAALPSLLVVSLPPGPAPATGRRPAFLVGGESAGRPRPDVAPLLSGERAVPRVNALKAI